MMAATLKVGLALALLAVICPHSHGQNVDVVIVVDGYTYLNTQWSYISTQLVNFLSGSYRSQYSGTNFAILVTSVDYSNSNFVLTSASASDASAAFSTVSTQVTSEAVDTRRWFGFSVNSMTSQGIRAARMILLSDFGWTSGQQSTFLDAISGFFSASQVAGEVLAVQLTFNGDSAAAIQSGAQVAQSVAQRFNGYYAVYGINSFNDVALSNDYQAAFLSSATPSPVPTSSPTPAPVPGVTDPPEINTPELIDTGCLTEADVIFCIDASTSISNAAGGLETYWDLQLDFVKRVIERVDVGPDRIRVALVVFARSVEVAQNLGDTTTKQNLLNRIDNLNFIKGSTATGDALAAASSQVINYPRDVRKVIVLITDGNPNEEGDNSANPNWRVQAERAKTELYITIAAVGIGNINLGILTEIASSAALVRVVENFEALENKVPEVYRSAFCDVTYCPLLDYADILFILPTNNLDVLNMVKDYATDIIYTLKLEQSGNPQGNYMGSRVAIISMGSSAQLLIDLDDNINFGNGQTSRRNRIDIINNIQYRSDPGSNLFDALNMAYNTVFTAQNGDRPSARNLIIMFANTDTGNSPLAIAQSLKEDKEVTIQAIQEAIEDEDLNLKEIMEAVASREPIDGGRSLYDYRSFFFDNYPLPEYTVDYMYAACKVMQWTIVPPIEGLKGAPGDTGERGIQGVKGPTGLKGPDGPQGFAGQPGTPGQDGINGARGDAGSPGSVGNKGAQGPIGPAGDKGNRGQDGFNGPNGPNGRDGDKGDIGFPGQEGAKGNRGVGVPGSPGDNGDVGFAGSPGSPGQPGSQGAQGSEGAKGDSGAEGVRGFQGSPGLPGPVGFPGDKGNIGIAGVDGVGVPGIKGLKGNGGQPGAPGANGIPGSRGSQGDPGNPGNPGFNGVKGEAGQNGANGLPGSPGANGAKGNAGTPGD